MAIPAFGLGTFRLKDDVVIASVKTALELGYRAIDTAQIYDNEAAVGQAIAESGVPRNELYITTKIWIENLSKDKLIPSLKESLQKLRTDYVDLTLIHWPSPNDEVSVEFKIKERLFRSLAQTIRVLTEMKEKHPETYKFIEAKMYNPLLTYTELADMFSCRKQNVLYHLKKAIILCPELQNTLLIDTRFSGGHYALRRPVMTTRNS